MLRSMQHITMGVEAFNSQMVTLSSRIRVGHFEQFSVHIYITGFSASPARTGLKAPRAEDSQK